MLPNLNMPEFTTNLPSSGKEVTFRSFLVKEEKILLMALEGGDSKDVENAILRVLINCINLDEQEILDLPAFDIEFLFLQLRSKSINNVATIRLSHRDMSECKHKSEVEINLDNVKVDKPDGHTNKIMLSDSVGVVFKYPSLRDSYDLNEKLSDSNVDNLFTFIAGCIEYVFDSDQVYENAPINEKIKFIESINQSQFAEIMKFYTTIPTVTYNSNYICEHCGVNEEYEIRGINNFF